MNYVLRAIVKLRRAWRRAVQFAIEDAWDIEIHGLPALRRAGIRVVRVLYMVIKGFRDDECPMHAAALTFNTLMAVVPVLALSLALMRGLGNEETAKHQVRSLVAEWTSNFNTSSVPAEVQAPPEGGVSREAPEAAADDPAMSGSALADEINRLVDVGFEKVENISFAALGGAGLAVLLWMVVSVLGQIEGSFNVVWGVTQGRSLWRKVTDYLSMIFIVPFLAILATSLPVADFATRYLDDSAAQTVKAFLGSGALKNLTVIAMTGLCFAFIIMAMPNTRVKILPGLSGGLVSGILFIVWMLACATLQVGVGRTGRIYGSFAVVPILLAWVYVSWQIVLFGAEVAFAIQNCNTYRVERDAPDAGLESRATLALMLVTALARGMHERRGATDINAFASAHRLPARFVNAILGRLVRAGLLAEVGESPGSYVLLRSPAELSAKDVVDAVTRAGGRRDILELSAVDPSIRALVSRLDAGLEGAMGSVLVAELAADAS